jgi:hypothetical protein
MQDEHRREVQLMARKKYEERQKYRQDLVRKSMKEVRPNLISTVGSNTQ